MPTIPTTVTPVQIKLGVTDKARAQRFYEDASGLIQQFVRHTEDEDMPGYQFGDYGQPSFFLRFLLDESDFDRPPGSTIGFLVRPRWNSSECVAAGAAEAVAPADPRGMPRTSAVTDPDGKWIWLYQG